MFEVPSNKKYIKDYLDILYINYKILPSPIHYREFEAFYQILINRGDDDSLGIFTSFPNAFHDWILNFSKFKNNSKLFFVIDYSFQDLDLNNYNQMICSNTCGLFSYKSNLFNRYIERSLSKLVFLYDIVYPDTKRFKLSDQVFDGMDYFSWKHYMKSNNHMGVKSNTIQKYYVEYW